MSTTAPIGDPVDFPACPMWLRADLVAGGTNDKAIARLVRAGALVKLRHGAYADGPAFRALDPAGRVAVTTRAVLRQAKTDVVASHVSAAPEYGAPLWGLDLSGTHLTRLDGRTGRNEAGVFQHCGTVEDGDVVARNGILVSSATRSAIEVSTVAGVEASLAYVNFLLHERLTTEEAIAERYQRMVDWPRTLSTQVVLRLARPEIESLGESRTFHLCYRYAIPMPVTQFIVHGSDGVEVARLDFAWPQLGVFLEFDGREKYLKYLRPGESPSDAVWREKKREDLVRRLTGWICIRLTWADLEHPERTAAMILEVLRRRAA